MRDELLGLDVHEGDGLAHYARACTDITFRFPFGTQELMGIAARGDYDLRSHAEGSGKGELICPSLASFCCRSVVGLGLETWRADSKPDARAGAFGQKRAQKCPNRLKT